MKCQSPGLTIKIPDMGGVRFDPDNKRITTGMCVRFELEGTNIVANLVLPDCFYRRSIELRPSDRSSVDLKIRTNLREEKYPFVVRRQKPEPRAGGRPTGDPEPIEEELDANPVS